MATPVPKNLIREIIKENDFQNPGEIYVYLKEMFRDVLQEALEAEVCLPETFTIKSKIYTVLRFLLKW